MTNTATNPLYLVEVRGANGSAARIGRWEEQIYAHTSGSTGWEPATVYPHDLPDSATAAERDRHPRAAWYDWKGTGHPRVALFTSRRAAETAIADGEVWNGQQVRVRAARGVQRSEGVVIDSYQAPHRPRRDPSSAPRVVRAYRVHPDTAAAIVDEAERSGESQGQVLDRLAAGLKPPLAPA